MSKWITDRKPTIEDADCTGFVWITTEYGVVLREPWKTVRDRPWMPITPPEPYVEPPKRYKLMYRSTTRQYYIQDTESCDKRFVASCIPTREKAYRISNIFDEQNSMSRWITDRRPTEEDADYGDVHLNGYVYVTSEIGMTKTATWKAAAYKGVPWQPFSLPEPYVKRKRFVVKRMMDIYSDIESCGYCVYNNIGGVFAKYIPTREAAERIAAIYEEVMNAHEANYQQNKETDK